MTETLKVISPVDGSVYVERPLADEKRIEETLRAAQSAQRAWRETSLQERAALCSKFVDAFMGKADDIALELTWQMGRPIKDSPGELRGFEERARHMIEIAPQSLADMPADDKEGFRRFIRREPLGVVFVIAAWNYPYLISVNGVIPALMAGNAVVLKHSGQTPLCAERFAEAFEAAGLPAGLFSVLHLSHTATERVVKDERVAYVNFTGSVSGGRSVHRAGADRFIAMGLELGGKDPGYVRPDADIAATAASLVDGAFYNAGQSCCGIERVYAHASVYDSLVQAMVELTHEYVLGDPTDPATTMGPMVRTRAATFVSEQVESAIAAGATALIDSKRFERSGQGAYLGPQVLVDVNHAMDFMRDETFGPAVGIMKVADDDEAVRLMNDSPFGLSASVWTRDEQAALEIGDRIETGTWFMNRCDYLDPALAWVGVKDSGRGCTLSSVGYEHLTRPKSFHLKVGS